MKLIIFREKAEGLKHLGSGTTLQSPVTEFLGEARIDEVSEEFSRATMLLPSYEVRLWDKVIAK
jgi:hypothetical protein